ncbi:MAG: hypothetical protein SH818_09750, partial [Saprospiraceae bacterium]|nr:hypothetical protein [Saprospiraceae bacterium]
QNFRTETRRSTEKECSGLQAETPEETPAKGVSPGLPTLSQYVTPFTFRISSVSKEIFQNPAFRVFKSGLQVETPEETLLLYLIPNPGYK